MAKNRYTKVGMMRGLIDAVYDSAPQQTQAPSMNFGMSKADIDSIYDGAIANQTQNQAPEIPKLEDNTVNTVQNTPATPVSTGNQTITDELERMRKVKAENKPRSESEQRAIDTYLADLERASQPGYKPDFNAEIERMKALDNDTTVNWSEGEKKAREDYLTSLQGVVAEEQRKQTEERARQAYANRTVKNREKAAEKAAEITERPVKEQKQTAPKRIGYAKEEIANLKDQARVKTSKAQKQAKDMQRNMAATYLKQWSKEYPLMKAATDNANAVKEIQGFQDAVSEITDKYKTQDSEKTSVDIYDNPYFKPNGNKKGGFTPQEFINIGIDALGEEEAQKIYNETQKNVERYKAEKAEEERLLNRTPDEVLKDYGIIGYDEKGSERNGKSFKNQISDYYGNDVVDYTGTLGTQWLALKNKSDIKKQIMSEYGLSEDEFKNLYSDYQYALGNQKGKERAEEANQFGQEHPVLGSLSSVGYGAAGALSAPFTLAYDLGTDRDKISPYERGHIYPQLKSENRSGVSSNINSGAGKTIYNMGMGLADMGVSTIPSLVTGGAVNPATLMAMQTASDYSTNALNNSGGLNPQNAALYGLGSGAIDYLTNAPALDALKDSSSVLGALGKGALVEGGANMAQEAASSYLDRLINGEYSEWNIIYQDALNNGYPEAEARKMANDAIVSNILSAGAGGAAFGALFAGGHAIANGINTRRLNNALENNTQNDIPTIRELAEENADIDNSISNQEQAVENLQNLKQQIPEIPEENEIPKAAEQNTNDITEIEEDPLSNGRPIKKYSAKKVNEIKEYVSRRKELIDYIQNRATSGDISDPIELLQLTNRLNNLDGYMNDNYPELFNINGDFIGLEKALSKTNKTQNKTQNNKTQNNNTIENRIEFNSADAASIRETVKAIKRSFIGKARYINDGNNKYALQFRDSLDEFAKNPNSDTYAKVMSDYDNYVANSGSKNMTNWYGEWYTKTYDEAPIRNRLNELADKYGVSKDSDKTLNIETPIEYDTKKIADKEINDGINTLANMYKRNGEEELIGSYRAALNEYAQTGSAESLQKARSIAEELDGRFAGREYTTKKGRIHGFDSGYQGRFTDFAEMLEYRRNMAQPVRDTIIERAPELNDKIDNLFGRFGYTEDQAQLVSNLKRTINDIANGDTSEDTLTRFVDELSKVELSYRNAEEYVSSFKGKAKRKPFDMSEANEIMEDTFDIAKKNQANASVPEAVEQGAKNAALNASDDTARLTVEPTSNNIANGNDNIPPKSMNVDLSEGEEAERGLAKHLRSQVDVRVATPMKVEGVPDEVANDFVDNLDMYKVLKNKDTKDLADNIYNSGEAPIEINGKEYTGNVETKFRSLLSEKNPASLPLGHQIAKDYSAAGNYEMASQIYRDMGQALTESGQFSQAAIINMIKDDPLTAMHYAQKEIDAMNEQGAKRFKKKWKDFAFTDEEIEAFNKINPGDEQAIKELYEKIGARLGKEYPTTMLDKLLEGRKVAMLLNPRTWSRNIVANVPTLGMRWVSDRVEGLGQSIVHLIDPTFEKTQAITGGGRKGRKLASQFTKTDAYEKLIKGTQGKYEVPELKNSLMNNVQTYKGTGLERWLDRVIGNGFNKAAEKLGKDIRIDGGIQALNKALYGKEGVQSVLETLRNTTYKALDLGDNPFVKENFVSRLGSYINAQGIKNLEDIPDEAIQTAWEEAMKATYKDNSWAVQMLKGLRNASMEKIPGIGRPLAQAVIPFVQAPGNIAARMIDYSPIRGTKGVADIISGAVKKDHNAIRRGIEEFSKGATGTGMVLLGMKLRESGILTGDYSENKQQREMQKRDGFKPWALKVGDKYFTYNWAQPFGENLIIGTLLQEAIEKSDQYDSDILRYFGVEGSKAGKVVGATWKGTKAAVNSWFNESPLKGLQELMSGGGYGKDDIAQNLADTGIGDFAGALVPAAVNAYTKTQDPVKRNTYDPSNTFATFLNQQQAKLPGASEKLPVLYDTWGEEQKYANSKGESAFQRFLYPGEYGVQEDDPIDIEINRLFDSPQGKSYDDRGFETTDNTLAGDEGVFPTKAPTSVSGRKLTNEEVSAYQEDMGKRSRRIVEAFMNSKLYQDMNDEQRIDALKNIYATSKAITERDLFNKPISDTYKKRVEAFDNYKAYDERGFEKSKEDSSIEGVLKSFEASKLINDAGVKSNTKIAEEITEAVKAGNYEKAEDLSQSVPTLESLGLGDVHPAVYAKAKRKFPDISVEDFADMYKKIDGADGTKPNYAIAQTELIPYLNMYYKPTGTEEEQKKIKDDALKVWYTFQKDDVKHIPVYEGGKWVNKKK